MTSFCSGSRASMEARAPLVKSRKETWWSTTLLRKPTRCRSTSWQLLARVQRSTSCVTFLVAWRQLFRRRVNTPRAKQLAEPLGLFVKWERDAEGLFMDFKDFLVDRVWRDVLLEITPSAVKEISTQQICTSKDRLGKRGEGEGVRAPWIAAVRIPPIATVGSVTSHQHVFMAPKIDMPQLKTVSLTIYDPDLDAVTKGT